MLKTDVDLGDEKVFDELGAIKKSYTMASEHKIHETVTQYEGDVELFDYDNNEYLNDDNLELF